MGYCQKHNAIYFRLGYIPVTGSKASIYALSGPMGAIKSRGANQGLSKSQVHAEVNKERAADYTRTDGAIKSTYRKCSEPGCSVRVRGPLKYHLCRYHIALQIKQKKAQKIDDAKEVAAAILAISARKNKRG